MPACTMAVASTFDLDPRLASGQHVALKVGRDVDDEGELAGVHQGSIVIVRPIGRGALK